MKKKHRYTVNGETKEVTISYIPVRFILAIHLTVLETLAIVAIVILLCYYVPYFYLAVWATEIACVIKIVSSDDNPDYKIPWLLYVLILPIGGFLFYFLFYSRKLKRKYIARLEDMKHCGYARVDGWLFDKLKTESPVAYNQAKMLCALSGAHLFHNTKQTYFALGEQMHQALLADLAGAKRFILMEYFIIEDGVFWDSILEILKQKAAAGVRVRVLYDDIGCMMTLPGNYDRVLGRMGIEAAPFSALKGQADSEFNNRSHRKITVIDGRIGYTGGVNLADEYINAITKHGHWKDTGIRLEGEAVWELTRLFTVDFGISRRKLPEPIGGLYPQQTVAGDSGYLIPFGDGPRPLYDQRVAKSLIQAMVMQANRFVYITTPYLIVDNELCAAMEQTARRGVAVKIIVPHVPDKRLVLEMTRSYYKRLTSAGVEIYEYTPGFIHAKSYLVDGEIGMIGTVNLDYRSLVHHFENGVWLYRCAVLKYLQADFEATLKQATLADRKAVEPGLIGRAVRACVRVFAPLL